MSQEAKIDKRIVESVTLVNIDSTFRNIYPKNITKSTNKVVPVNPLSFATGSNVVTINYTNHELEVGDNIVLQNVEGVNKIISNSFYLINNFKYLMINFSGSNFIETNYKDYAEELLGHIEVYGSVIEENFIGNMPFNYLIGIKKLLIANDIPENYLQNIKDFIIKQLGSYDLVALNKNYLFVELPTDFINKERQTYQLVQAFKITYLHIGGIKLGYLNANYPINNYNYQSYQTVLNVIDDNTFQILLNYYSYGKYSGGGSNVQISKIVNSLIGYPDADTYTIHLKKSFNNVTNIKLISTEFPYIDVIIKKNINDKLYWKNIEDGNYVYHVQIDEGFYTPSTLLDKIQNNINLVERITSTDTTKSYNNFEVLLEANNQKIIFKPSIIAKLPDCLSLQQVTIGNQLFYILNVEHPNNIVEVNDTITIDLATEVTVKVIINGQEQILSIDNSYINKAHQVYSVNIENQTYQIILGNTSQVKTSNVNFETGGGENVTLRTKSKSSFLFNKPDTIGEILGFKYVGDPYSFTDFKSEISNDETYILNNDLNTVGNNIGYSSGYLNLSGMFNYYLMYLNDIEYIHSNNNMPAAFSKILLAGNPGDILFNTHVEQPTNVYSKNFPIVTLTDIVVKFMYPNGNRVNFRNVNHSFTLQITEDKIQNEGTYISSQNISVSDEFKKAQLKN